MTVLAFTDGAARGNPGESGIGIVLKDERGAILRSLYGYIGIMTNNAAEYIALLTCLKLVGKIDCTKLTVHSDSELMVRQMTGRYKVKDAALKRYFQEIHRIKSAASYAFEIKHIVRELNGEADRLANLGIDSRLPLKI
jgi:ribonuclease HI